MAIALKNNSGGSGASAVGAPGVSRLDIIDPHLVQMMRDVMDASDTAGRVAAGQGAGGGGGGGGGSKD